MRPLPYEAARHRERCLALFDGNVAGPGRPDGTFAARERADFAGFLDALPGPYRVLEEPEGHVIACGGWAPEGPGLLSLCWTVVDRSRQGEGVGRRLVEGLVREAGADRPGARLRLDTVPATVGFFRKLGFRVVEVVPGGYGPEMPDRVEMERAL